jgi:signal transduction histidine kinase
MTTIFYKILVGLGLCCVVLQGQGRQADTLFLHTEVDRKINLLPALRVFSTPQYLSPEKALEQIQVQGKTLPEASVGFTRDTYWATLTLKNSSTSHLSSIIEINSPQIDCLQVYTYSALKIIPWALTGDKFPFHQRLIPHRNFAFPMVLAPGESKSLLLKIEKRNSSLSFPIYLWNQTAFHQNDYTENIGYGLYFGLILLCALYSILTFGFLRNSIYFWYFVWITSSGVFVFTALGFSHQFLYPSANDFNSIFRVIIQVINLIAFLKFSQKFLRMERFTPKTDSVLHYTILFLVALAIPVPFKPPLYFEYSHILLPFLNWLMLFTLGTIIYSIIVSFNHQKIIIYYYIGAFAALIIGIFCVVAIEFGVISAERFPVDPFLIGSSLEYLIFAVGLTYQIKKVYDERNNLSFRFAQQQKELLKAYVDGVERERERISRELHDDIGSRLSTLNRFVTSGNTGGNSKLQEQIEILCEDVRSMSHELAPPALKITGLKSKVFELARELKDQRDIQVDIQFYDFPENLSDEVTMHLYRILQEAFNNISKHAEATLVDLQFFGHEDELVITIEDNGRGFSETASSGIGLQNMKARSASIHGILEINSQPGRGTQLLLRIPNPAAGPA